MVNESNVLELYLKDINKVPLLTREEETSLAIEAAKGNKAAKDKIVNANLRFVVNIAKKYQNHGLDLTDLISEGNIGLLVAIDRFDVTKGYHFISYAVWWIRQSILKAICEKSRSIRLPLNRANELVRIEHARKSVVGNKTIEQELTEVAEMLNMDKDHVREMINISREMISLDAELSTPENDKTSVGDFIEDTQSEKPEDKVVNDSLREEINNVLHTLKPSEENVLRLRFGLNGEKPMSLKEVGDVCNLTKERIRQIEKHAILRMQHVTRARRLESYVS
ncbi:MAG: RNA polymerase sigma factor RpoD/SigA [Treponema sp.]|nr:RNA polymerase sigma factor RpoD/SigA [Treponema sp.]MBQ5876642.1 RNA polymerase sigma factor RpoD/SigA [Treponema sp.]